MFNLIVGPCDWSATNNGTIAVGRIFEHTESSIADQFKQHGSPDLNKLLKLPCLFMNEGRGDQRACIGTIINQRKSGEQILFEYTIDNSVPLLKNKMLYDARIELGIQNEFEFFRTHWAVKNADMYRCLLRNINTRRRMPTVFKLPEYENIDTSLVSVMMPFDSSYTEVYKNIKKAAKDVGLKCNRADDFWEHNEIMQDVVKLIDIARVVVCDCTGRNPNVFYETGIAHTLGRDVILITQNTGDIPFDLRHLRYIQYHNNKEGRAKLKEELQARLNTLLQS